LRNISIHITRKIIIGDLLYELNNFGSSEELESPSKKYILRSLQQLAFLNASQAYK